MKRCTAVRNCLASQRRWGSYDRAALTKDNLVQQVESGFGKDAYGQALKLDPETKTIQTASGALPISPIFDPEWMQARRGRRQRKEEAGPRIGRFRRKLANNPYARALAMPVRFCAVTGVTLPRFFMQDVELVKHPETGSPWWAPGPLSVDYVARRMHTPETTSRATAEAPVTETSAEDDAPVTEPPAEDDAPVTEPLAEEPVSQSAEPTDAVETWRPRRAPVTSYVLGRKKDVDSIGETKSAIRLTARRHGLSSGTHMSGVVWRRDMGDVILQMMRQHATDALITRTTGRVELLKYRFVQPCSNWDAVKDVKLRGCVLWLPGEQTEPYATLDVEASYGRKMVVHNLHRLLGEDEVARLKEASDFFRSSEILVLKQWPSRSSMSLHLLLWRLHGYLA